MQKQANSCMHLPFPAKQFISVFRIFSFLSIFFNQFIKIRIANIIFPLLYQMNPSPKLIFIIITSVLLRVGFIIYLSNFESISKQDLSATDIDYKVYTDAAYQESPYFRHTYRYTPLLAYMMKFNHYYEYAGKLIFVFFDLVAMIGLIQINRSKYKNIIVSLYGWNPLFIYLTVRGSCESISLALMFWTFKFIFQVNGNITLGHILNRSKKIIDTRRFSWVGYVLYGLWIHFRVYPVIFFPLIILHEYNLSKKVRSNFKLKLLQILLLPVLTFSLLLLYFYSQYGQLFVEETYLYHTKRLDNRHSFSPFFYEIYLSLNTQSFLRSLPQLIVIVAVSKRLHSNLSSYNGHFLITYAFVSFNKVITMQYYMWIFGALLLLLPQSTLVSNPSRRIKKAFAYIIQYSLGILLWVWSSIRLEKYGENVFNMMWLICIGKLFLDLWALKGFMSTITNKQQYQSINSQEKQDNRAKVSSAKAK